MSHQWCEVVFGWLQSQPSLIICIEEFVSIHLLKFIWMAFCVVTSVYKHHIVTKIVWKHVPHGSMFHIFCGGVVKVLMSINLWSLLLCEHVCYGEAICGWFLIHLRWWHCTGYILHWYLHSMLVYICIPYRHMQPYPAHSLQTFLGVRHWCWFLCGWSNPHMVL